MEIGLWQLLQLVYVMPVVAQVASGLSAVIGLYAAFDRFVAKRGSSSAVAASSPPTTLFTATAEAAPGVTPDDLALMQRWTAADEFYQQNGGGGAGGIPKAKDWIHVAVRVAGFIAVATAVISTVVVTRYDFNEEYNRVLQDLQQSRATAKTNFASNCLVEHTAPICDTWRVAKDWTDATVASKAFHGACAHVGQHVSDTWDWLTGSWAVWFLVVSGGAYWVYHGPMQAVRDANTLHARGAWVAAMRAQQAKAIQLGTVRETSSVAAAAAPASSADPWLIETSAMHRPSTNYADHMTALPIKRSHTGARDWAPVDRA